MRASTLDEPAAILQIELAAHHKQLSRIVRYSENYPVNLHPKIKHNRV